MNSFDAERYFLYVVRSDYTQSEVPSLIPRNCFSCKIDGTEILSSSLKPVKTADGPEYELAKGFILELAVRDTG